MSVSVSVSVRHEAELEDGRRLLLLDDRGALRCARRTGGEAPDDEARLDQLDAWALTSVEEIEETARFVVGPDEPAEGRSEGARADSWAYLAGVPRRQGSTCRRRGG